MIDHMTVTVTNLQASKDFFLKALGPLGYRVHMEFPQFAGIGDSKPWLWLKEGATPSQPMHIAFVAKSRALVDAFHSAALAAGAKDDGPPGPRTHYHPNYYGAFVIDPVNGHPVEAVCHLSPEAIDGAVKAVKAKPAKAAAKKVAKAKPAAKAKAKAKGKPAKKRR